MNNLIAWVWITIAFGPGNPRMWNILEEYDLDIISACDSLINGDYQKLSDYERSSIKSTHIHQAEKIIDYCVKKGINIVTYDDNSYPNRLRGIYNPPTILFCMGDLSFIDNSIAITVVGTRKPCEYSIKLAKRLCHELSMVGVTLVSGFALGIDSMVHQAALRNHGRTIAVLGCGIDVDYPRPNTAVKGIIARHGAVISEFFPGTPPDGRNFPQRNRIMSALSLGTVVVEASAKSGALITAELALQQGKDVFCVPPADLFDERFSGVIKFLRDGAIPIFSHLDIIYEYYENFSHKINSGNPYADYTTKTEDCMLFDAREKLVLKQKHAEKFDSAPTIPKEIDFSLLTEEQALIVKIIQKEESLLSDEIAEIAELDSEDILPILTELELSGIVISQAGKRFALA